MAVVSAARQIEMQACVVEEPRAVLFRRFEQLCSVSTESERSIHVLEGPGMVTEDYIREAAVDDERIVIRPARDFALTLVDDRELALCSIVARLQLPAARPLFLGSRRRELATFPFDRDGKNGGEGKRRS